MSAPRIGWFFSLVALPMGCSSAPNEAAGSALSTPSGPGTATNETAVPSDMPAATEGVAATPATAPDTVTVQPPPESNPSSTPAAPVTPPPTSSEVASTGGSTGEGPLEPEAPAGTGGDMSSGGMGGTMVTGGASGMPAVGGTAGTLTAGAGGANTAGGGGGGTDADVAPSAGCGQGGRPQDGKVYVEGESWLVFPEAYDGNTPMPVLFGFHGCGSGNRGDASRTEYLDATRNNVFEDEYVVAIPISSDPGGCWNYGTDIGRIKNLYDELTNNHCVDTNRVFATGHSSGAYISVALLTADHAADAAHLNLRGIAPVAASPVNNHSTPMPVFYMENPNDTERNDDNASVVVGGFRDANMCGEGTQPYEGVDSCNSSSGGAMVDPGCIVYEGCTHPTVWCSHNDQSYGTTGHGIPCFAAQAMDRFFKSL